MLNEIELIKNKIKAKNPLEIGEIAKYLSIEERIIKNIFVMYEAFGRKSVESITLSNEEIDNIIKLKYPNVIFLNKEY